MKFYISDLHLNHTAILRHCNRKFKSTKEMNKRIITNWNNVISEEDDVYILGDIALAKTKEEVEEIIEIFKILKGRKYLIVGNHDKTLLKNPEFVSLFKWIKPYAKIKDGDQGIVLFHYPILEWDGYHKGIIHLYGHVHNSPIPKVKNSFNVCVDVNHYMPLTLEEIIKRINKSIF